MVGNNNRTSLLRLMVDRTGDMVDGGLTGAVRTIDVQRGDATGGTDHGRGDEELRRRQGGGIGSGLDEERVGRLVQVEGAEGVYLEVCLVEFGGFGVDGHEGGVYT